MKFWNITYLWLSSAMFGQSNRPQTYWKIYAIIPADDDLCVAETFNSVDTERKWREVHFSVLLAGYCTVVLLQPVNMDTSHTYAHSSNVPGLGKQVNTNQY